MEKGNLLINMDSQAPNRAAAGFLPKLLPGLTLLRPETVYGSSRSVSMREAGRGKWFWEVKGVTLEEDGHVSGRPHTARRETPEGAVRLPARKATGRGFCLSFR